MSMIIIIPVKIVTSSVVCVCGGDGEAVRATCCLLQRRNMASTASLPDVPGVALTWPPVVDCVAKAPHGYGIAACPKRGLVFVSCCERRRMSIRVYRASDGALVTEFGRQGVNPGEFDFHSGGMAVTVTGTLLVAEAGNNRVQEVDVTTGGHVRFLGSGWGYI